MNPDTNPVALDVELFQAPRSSELSFSLYLINSLQLASFYFASYLDKGLLGFFFYVCFSFLLNLNSLPEKRNTCSLYHVFIIIQPLHHSIAGLISSFFHEDILLGLCCIFSDSSQPTAQLQFLFFNFLCFLLLTSSLLLLYSCFFLD